MKTYEHAHVPLIDDQTWFVVAYDETTIAVGLARVGCDEQQIVCGTMKSLISHDLGPPLHSLIIPGEMHFLEKEMLNEFAVDINKDEN